MSTAVATRLYRDVIAPLVLGGALRPGRPIGGEAALELWAHSGSVDPDLRSRTDLARTRVFRHLTAIDVIPEAGASEWALLASVHDWLAAASPALPGIFSRNAGDRLLALVEGTLAHLPPPRDAAEALNRHSFLARLFEVERKDVKVSYWIGSQTFLGAKPPGRLLAWRELRRVRTETEGCSLTSLAEYGARVDKDRWLAVLDGILKRSPLTNLAHVTREKPAFVWSPETLGFVRAKSSRTLVIRALRGDHETDALAALGRATRALAVAKQWKSVGAATELLAELVLGLALGATPGEWSRILAQADHSSDLFAGIAFGALTAAARAEPNLAGSDLEALNVRLGPLVRSHEAKALLAT